MGYQSRAAVLREYGGEVSIETIEVDEPADNEVLVRTAACGVCHSDLHFKQGAMPHFPVPTVMGHEAAGVVEKVGKAVRGIEAGDHVVVCNTIYCGTCQQCLVGRPHLCLDRMGPAARRPKGAPPRLKGEGGKLIPFTDLGGFSELMLLPERAVVKIDKDIPLDRAALIGCAVLTGVGAALNTAQIKPGGRVAVFGCGGIGASIIQGARIAGAREIFAVDIMESKLEQAKSFGATDVIDSSKADPVATIREKCGGVDYAFDAVGNTHLLCQCFSSLGPRGTAVLVGAIPAGQKVEIEARGFLGEKSITGSLMGSNRFKLDVPFYLDLYRQGRLDLDSMISARRPLDQLNEAFKDMEGGAALRTVITF
ncbi:Alcohol dehydrogenase GroES domain protein [Sphingobium chlorophenolicum L-1]|uniref:Alcohol dehydrogenase GroES domain protein n=1 Tax=Sphingobium chlorophenolicum L-1 TaxID=690566 RepID=F6F1K6_SPHCR|nr:Zn-dependent alcohol dehydrogenase [Sphingobium chlorophenolicum]AEG51422.1 Alcohol dehydrogenase GroES domain protein [Sphingobium chlorophenolicum L-1]